MGVIISKIINCEYCIDCIDCIDNCKQKYNKSASEIIELPLPPQKSCIVSKSQFRDMKKRKVVSFK